MGKPLLLLSSSSVTSFATPFLLLPPEKKVALLKWSEVIEQMEASPAVQVKRVSGGTSNEPPDKSATCSSVLCLRCDK
jgi:hypothetical protein